MMKNLNRLSWPVFFVYGVMHFETMHDLKLGFYIISVLIVPLSAKLACNRG